jgi:hypothetical protein
MSIRKADINPSDFFTSNELQSDGTFVYLSGNIVSAASNIITVTLNNTELISPDNPVQPLDIAVISNTGVIDGSYSVVEVLSGYTFSVSSIPNYVGSGNINFVYRSGASNIGFNVSGRVITTDNTVQNSIGQIDSLLSSGFPSWFLQSSGVGSVPSWANHDTLLKLVHLRDGPYEGFNNCYEEILPVGTFPTSITWYTDNTKQYKILEKFLTYNSNLTVSKIVWNLYNSSQVKVETLTENIVYSGIFEINRTRVFS